MAHWESPLMRLQRSYSLELALGGYYYQFYDGPHESTLKTFFLNERSLKDMGEEETELEGK